MKKTVFSVIIVFFSFFVYAKPEILTQSFGKNLIYDYSKEREISTVTFFFDGGSMNCTKENAGIEKFILEAIQKGSKKYSESDINLFSDRYGLKISVTVNYDYSAISFTSFSSYFGEVLRLAADLLQNPLFPEKNVEIIRKNMIETINAKSKNPDELIWLKLNDWFFREHQYAGLPDGYVESVSKITVEDMRQHLKFLTRENRVVVSVVTGIPRKVLEPVIKENFSFLNTAKEWKKSIPADFRSIGKDTILFEKKENLETSYVACKFNLPSVTDDAYGAARLGMSILSKRIYETLRTKHGLTYAAYMGASDKKVNYGVFYVSTTYPDSAISLFYQEMNKAKTEGVSQREIDDLRNIYETSFYMGNEKSEEKSFSNGYNFMVYGDADHDSKFMKRVSKMKPSEITDVLKKWLENYQFLILRKE
ncbi:MAG: pitrilysin family protein [bacterium]|nr:pitrilysin family protein [bacterium]